jgi:hypothetical protein
MPFKAFLGHELKAGGFPDVFVLLSGEKKILGNLSFDLIPRAPTLKPSAPAFAVSCSGVK